MDGMTFIDKDGMTHCMNKNSDKTVEVKCVDDEEKPVTDPPVPPVPGDKGVWGGSGPGHFPHLFFQKKNVFKMHFKPFQAILDHVFLNFFGWVPLRTFQKKLKKT